MAASGKISPEVAAQRLNAAHPYFSRQIQEAIDALIDAAEMLEEMEEETYVPDVED